MFNFGVEPGIGGVETQEVFEHAAAFGLSLGFERWTDSDAGPVLWLMSTPEMMWERSTTSKFEYDEYLDCVSALLLSPGLAYESELLKLHNCCVRGLRRFADAVSTAADVVLHVASLKWWQRVWRSSE
ncbi:hypothetical protein Cob_v006695 [Colletotrichum orbiculare MAFF 240422]|uniref:Uncharacterized protein n=1 Tax=Colletotrichum orbiculare (strain 104-T / ATCC 96160 / CBS 514.97 / LARS 414 / MAFF 240422) TaxID=1213857 RepID=A0A484FQ13_COLOR|nr:hypothetical protein Cob_v006695 [Colletotrichum orbiculare MAFF 240422]